MGSRLTGLAIEDNLQAHRGKPQEGPGAAALRDNGNQDIEHTSILSVPLLTLPHYLLHLFRPILL